MATEGTLASIAIALARLFEPLQEELQVGRIRVFLAELGMEFPPELETKTAFINALEQAVIEATQLPELISELITAIEAEDLSKIANLGIDLFGTVKSLVENFNKIANELKNLGGSLPGISAPDLNAFANNLPKNIVDYLVVKNLEGTPGLAEAFEFIDAIERKENISGAFTYTTRKIKLNQFTNFISKPGNQLESLYDWGKPSFEGITLLKTLEKLLINSGVPAIFDQAASPPTLDLIFLEVKPKTDINPRGLEIVLLDKIIVDSEGYGQDDWKIRFVLDTQLGSGAQLIIQPNGNITFVPPTGQLQGDSFLEWIAGNKNGAPYLILGEPDGSRLEATQLSVKVGVGFAWNNSTKQAQGDFTIGGEVKGGKFLIDFSQGDGFLSDILSGIKLESNFDIGFGFSSKDGLFFYGSSTLLIQLPLHIDLGVINIRALTIGVGLEAGKVPISLGVDINANLGPLKAVIEQIGVKAELSFPSNQEGNLGPVDLSLGFKPPNGVGLSIDAGVVKGGGYLYFDFDKEEYAGALELVFSGFLTLKAIGLITTRMPDGSKGFSLLIIITAEFGSPIQLGFGFVLIGVGGLLGLNRTMRLEVIATGVRTGAVESIMFPRDVIENAPRIISDLREFFPPEVGIFLIGPMAKLGWGTPALVSVSLGIIIEIPPGNIVILGVLKVALPDEDAALIILQVNFIGAMEFDKKRIWFFASMYESRVLFITLEGEMGLLVAWGAEANFVLSVGGFHPSFNPPPLPFPNPKRLAISILNTSFAKIRVEGYFAVTSNTVQFGARVEIFFGLDEVNISGHLAFDALFQFSPFYFIITISASLGVKVFGVGLFSVHFRGELEGTSPWHIEGEGSISILFFSIDIPFSHTWGQEEDTTLPPIQVMPLLEAEFNKLDNWIAELPSSNTLLVSLRKIEATEDLVLHPVGVLRVSQRAVPLDLGLDKVGNQKPSDVKKVVINVPEGELKNQRDTEEPFATAQFKNLSDAQKLSSPAFEKQKAGVALSVSGEQLNSEAAVKRVVRYEEIIIDNNFKEHRRRFTGFIGQLFTHFLRGNAASRSPLSATYKSQKAPIAQKIAAGTLSYVVASNVDNSAFSAAAHFTSQAKANDFMQEQINKNPDLGQSLHVIPITEMREAV